MNPCESPASSPAPEGGKKKRQHWPIEIKNGSVTAKIYEITKGKRSARTTGKPIRIIYGVAYHLPSGRKIVHRGTLEKARDHARLMVDSIAAGEVDIAEMSKQDRMELLALRERAAVHGVAPLMAIDEWSKIRTVVGTEGIPAAEAWSRRRTKYQRIAVAVAVEKFLAAKQSDGVNTEASYEGALERFKAKFGDQFLDALESRNLNEWLQSTGKGRTRNTYRKRIVTLFRWARDEGYLDRDSITEADRTRRSKENATARNLISPRLFRKVLNLLQFGGFVAEQKLHIEPRPELVPVVTLGGFGGLRSCELHLQKWEDIDLEEGHASVTKAKEGTAADRFVPLAPVAIEWLSLTPKDQRSGPIHAYETEIMTIVRNHLCRAGIKLPGNTLRKSWVSHRLAVKPDVAAVSLEAGHSSQVEVRNYRGKVKPRVGKAWFEISPTDFASTKRQTKIELTHEALEDLGEERRALLEGALRGHKEIPVTGVMKKLVEMERHDRAMKAKAAADA